MQDNILRETLEENEIFKDYIDAFKPQAISKQLQKEWFKKSSFHTKDMKEKTKEYRDLFVQYLNSGEYKELEKGECKQQFINFAKGIECDKLKTFIQTNNNVVALLQSPPDKVNGKTNKKEIIEFLGYDWSNRKGDEGIKYITDRKIETTEEGDEKDTEIVTAINSIKFIKTPLYNPDNINDNTKFSYAIKKHIYESCTKFSFGENTVKLDDDFNGEMKQLFSCRKLSDLIDFSHANFDKKISLNFTKKYGIKSKWSTKRIEQILLKVSGNRTKVLQNEILDKGKIPVISQNRNSLIEGYTNNKAPITDLPVIVFGDHSCALKYVDFPFVRGADGTQLLKVNEDEIKTQYLYFYLTTLQIENADKYERHFKYLKTMLIPIPPLDIQVEIINKCLAVNEEIEKLTKEIKEAKKKIDTIVANIKGEKHKLGKIAKFKNGLNYNKSSVGEKISIVGVADFRENKSPIWKEIEKITINGKLDDNYLMHKNDLVTVRSNGSQELVGRFMYIDKEPEEKTSFSGFSIRVRPDEDIVKSEFLYYLLSSSAVRKQLAKGSNGSNIKSLNQTLLSNIEINIPHKNVQREILVKLREMENIISDSKSIIKSAIEKQKTIIEEELT